MLLVFNNLNENFTSLILPSNKVFSTSTRTLETIALCGTRCVIIDIQTPSFTRVNSLRLQSQCLAKAAFCNGLNKHINNPPSLQPREKGDYDLNYIYSNYFSPNCLRSSRTAAAS